MWASSFKDEHSLDLQTLILWGSLPLSIRRRTGCPQQPQRAKSTGYTATVEEMKLWHVCKWNMYSREKGELNYAHKYR